MNLSDDVLTEIFAFLERNKERLRLALVCKKWYQVAQQSITTLTFWNNQSYLWRKEFNGHTNEIYCPALEIIEQFYKLRTLKIELSSNIASLDDDMVAHLYSILPQTLLHVTLKGCNRLVSPTIATGKVEEIVFLTCENLKAVTLTGDCTSLRSIRLGIRGHQSCREFKHLKIDQSCHFSGNGLDVLDLSLTSVNDESLEQIFLELNARNCTAIRELRLGSCRYIVNVSCIGKYCGESLEHLDISGSCVVDRGLEAITAGNVIMKKLVLLNARNSSHLFRPKFLGECLPKLKILQLHFSVNLETIVINGLKELEKLDLDRTGNLSSLVIEGCNALTSLDISNTKVNDAIVQRVLHELPSLKGFYIRKCLELRRPHIVHSLIDDLKMDGCIGVQEEPVIKCPSLTALSLTGTRFVTQETINKIVNTNCRFVY
jgi:hypothetical protein